MAAARAHVEMPEAAVLEVVVPVVPGRFRRVRGVPVKGEMDCVLHRFSHAGPGEPCDQDEQKNEDPLQHAG